MAAVMSHPDPQVITASVSHDSGDEVGMAGLSGLVASAPDSSRPAAAPKLLPHPSTDTSVTESPVTQRADAAAKPSTDPSAPALRKDQSQSAAPQVEGARRVNQRPLEPSSRSFSIIFRPWLGH